MSAFVFEFCEPTHNFLIISPEPRSLPFRHVPTRDTQSNRNSNDVGKASRLPPRRVLLGVSFFTLRFANLSVLRQAFFFSVFPVTSLKTAQLVLVFYKQLLSLLMLTLTRTKNTIGGFPSMVWVGYATWQQIGTTLSVLLSCCLRFDVQVQGGMHSPIPLPYYRSAHV